MSSREDDHLRLLVASSSSDINGDEEDLYGTFGGGQVGHKRGGSSSSHPGGSSLDLEDLSNGELMRPRPLDPTARRRQTLAAAGYCSGAFAIGTALAWSSPALPQLETTATLTSFQAGWVGSLVSLGALLQGPVTAAVVPRVGRKMTMVAASTSFLAGWIIIGLSEGEFTTLCAGRLLCGAGAGAYSAIAPTYIAEIAAPDIRGFLGTLFQINVVSGICSTYIIGALVTWNQLAWICSVVPVVVAWAVGFMLKDSPASYMARGRPELARKALVWLRNSPDIDDELYSLQKSSDGNRNRAGRKSNICASDTRRALLTCMLIMVLQQVSGVNAVIFYAADIFASASVGNTNLGPNMSAVIVGIVQLVATCASGPTSNRVGRKPTLLVTEAIMASSLVAFGTFFYLKDMGSPVVEIYLSWLPVTALVAYIVAFSFGLGPLAWLMMGELLPPRVAGPAGALAASVNWTLAFFITMSFNYLKASLGDFGVYWLFAGSLLVGMVLTYKLVPETRGKSLRKIQLLFESMQ